MLSTHNMVTADYIAIAVIALIIGAAVFYIVRARRRGEKCVGCPYAKQCGGKCGSCGNVKSEKNIDLK